MFWLCMNMKINNQNNISFTSTPLHKVNIINSKTGELVPAVFSKLNPADKIDQKAIEEIKQNWIETPSHLMDLFADGFTKYAKKTEQYGAIELINENALSKKIVGITKFFQDKSSFVITPDNTVYLNVLVTNPAFSSEHKNTREFKNIGEVLFGEVFRYAKKIKSDCINFLSDEDEFYFKTLEDAGINARDNEDMFYLNSHEFTINSSYFDKYIDYWKNKFKIK